MYKLWLFAGIFSLCSCSGEDEPQVRTRAEFCQEWGRAACSAETVSRCQAASPEVCQTSQEAFCLTLVPAEFDGRRADECLSAVASAYRDGDLAAAELRTVLRLDAPCDRVVRGPSDEGETCATTRDCDGLSCVLKGDQSMGTCQEPQQVGPGEECTAAQQVCDARNYCNGSNCVVFKRAGTECTIDYECGPSAHCALEPTGTRVCRARLGVDSPCVSHIECISAICFTFANGNQRCLDRLPLSPSEPICEDLS